MKHAKPHDGPFTLKNGIWTILMGFAGTGMVEVAGKIFGALDPRLVLFTGWTLLAAGILTALIFMFLYLLSRVKRGRKPREALFLSGVVVLFAGLTLVLDTGGISRVYLRAELNADTVGIPVAYQFSEPAGDLALAVHGSGFEGSPFAVELEHTPAGAYNAEKLEIRGLEDAAIRSSRYYKIRPGKFTVPGRFNGGDIITLQTINSAGFTGKIVIELSGPHIKEKETQP